MGAVPTAAASSSARKLPSFMRSNTLAFPALVKPEYPGMHPLSNNYEHSYDLLSACNELRREFDHEGSRTRLQIKTFPRYMRSAWRRVCTVTTAPPGIGLIAMLDRGLRELDENVYIVAHRQLRLNIDEATHLLSGDQVDLDEMMGELRFYPRTNDKGVSYNAVRCTDAFKDQMTGAAASVGVPSWAFSVLCLCVAMRDQPGVSDAFADIMDDTYADFVDKIKRRTDLATAHFMQCLIAAGKAKPSSRRRDLELPSLSGDDG